MRHPDGSKVPSWWRKTSLTAPRGSVRIPGEKGTFGTGVTATGGYGDAVTDYSLVGTPSIPLDVLVSTTAVRAVVESLLYIRSTGPTRSAPSGP